MSERILKIDPLVMGTLSGVGAGVIASQALGSIHMDPFIFDVLLISATANTVRDVLEIIESKPSDKVDGE